MKKLFSTFVLTMAMLACSTATMAQDNGRQRISREELATKQALYIADRLAFDDATTSKFVSTYEECQKEIWVLGTKKKRAARSSEAETEQEIKDRFAHSQSLLDIRQKYYEKYSEYLMPNQIKRVYELERQMMKRLANHGKAARQQGRAGRHASRAGR